MVSDGFSSSVSLKSLFEEAMFFHATDIQVERCTTNAWEIEPGDLYVPQITAEEDGHWAVDVAMERGASAILCERILPYKIPQCVVEDTRAAFGMLCHRLHKDPSNDLITIGVAGSHGKTTLNLLIASMLKSIGGRVGYCNSLGFSEGKANMPSVNDKANAQQLARWMGACVENKVPGAILEINEHMLFEQSTIGATFDLIVLTSLRRPHGSKVTVKQYQDALLRQFTQLKEHGLVLYNRDDAALARWMDQLPIPAISYGMDADAEIRGRRLERVPSEQTLMISAGNTLMPLRSPLIGDHNARHLLGAVAAGHVCGLPLAAVIAGVEKLQRIPAHMQRIEAGQPFTLFVDQADTPDRLAVALHALQHSGASRVLCVADAMLDRDEQFRRDYGRVLERGSVAMVISAQKTADDSSVMQQSYVMVDGFEDPSVPHVLPDRWHAIQWILQQARPGDAILLAGLGSQKWTSRVAETTLSDLEAADRLLRQTNSTPCKTKAALKISQVPVAEPKLQTQTASVGKLQPRNRLTLYRPS